MKNSERSLGVDDSNVSRALSVMRNRNASWFDRNKDPLDRQLAEVERDIQDFVLVRKVQPLGPGVTMVPGNNK